MQLIERVLWRLVLILVVVGAVLCLWALLGHELTQSQAKILISSFGVAVYSSMGLACAAVLKRQPTSLGSRAGMGTSFVGAVLFVFGVWGHGFEHEWWWKLLGISFVTSFAACHASLLLLLRLDARFALVRTVTRTSIYAWAALLTFMILAERGDELWWRLVGVTSTIGAFGTLASGVLAKLSGRAGGQPGGGAGSDHDSAGA